MPNLDAEFTRFAEMAAVFCQWVEVSHKFNYETWVQLHTITASVYAAALGIPSVAATGEWNDQSVIYEKSRAISKRLEAELPVNRFWWMFHPLSEDGAPVSGSLADALSDIWCDLMRGLSGVGVPSPERQQDMLWHWKFSFDSHWGRHALEVMTVCAELETM